MAKKHETYLKNLFYKNNVVYDSTELLDKICEEFSDCSRDNARKVIQISKEKGIMKSSEGLTFNKNKKIYYSNHSELSYESIKEILKHNKQGLYRVLNRLYENGGVISYIEIAKLSSVPIKNSKTNIKSFNEVISFLKNKNTDKLRNLYCGNVNYLVSEDITDFDAESLMIKNNNKLQLDCIFLPPFLIWLQKHKIINTKNGVLYRNKASSGIGIIHNNLAWDGIAYTNAVGLSEFIDNEKDNQTLVVLDIKIYEDYNENDLKGFYDRIQIHRNSVKNKNNKRRILPIILARGITRTTSYQLNNLKMLYFELGTVYGERIYEILQNLNLTSINNIMGLNKEEQKRYLENIEETLEIVKKTGQDINLQNIKGELFERLIYMVLSRIYINGNIYHSKKITIEVDSKKINFEYDFIIETEDEFIVIEVKGYKKNTKIRKGIFIEKDKKPEKDTIKWFFSYTYPAIKKLYNENKRQIINNRDVKACYITTGQFEEEALKVLNEKNESKEKPQKMDIYYDREKLIELLKENNMKNEIRVIEQYY